MRAKLMLTFAALIISAVMLRGQAPTPAALQTPAPAAAVAAAPAGAAQVQGLTALLQALQQMKAANDELLKRQEATLQQLEEIAKAADQIRILTQRS